MGCNKLFIACLVCLGLGAGAWAEEVNRAQMAAVLNQLVVCIKAKNYADGAEKCNALAALQPHNPGPPYYLACMLALQNKPEEAFKALAQAMELGYDHPLEVDADKDLLSLHADKRFAELLAKCKANLAKTMTIKGNGFDAPEGGWPASPPAGFLRGVNVENDIALGAYFHLSVPKDYTPQKAWPLMVVLHGGVNGNAGNLVPVFKDELARRGVISVFPQGRNPERVLNWNYPHEGANLLRIVGQVARTYHIDPCRVYLIGHSMGGGGAYAMGATMRDLWGAVGVLSGWYWYGATPHPKPEWRTWLKDMPLYIIHGDQDHNVPVKLGQMANEDLKKMAHKNFVYVELPGVGHDVMTGHGEEIRKFLDWILAQKRAAPGSLATARQNLLEWGTLFNWKLEDTPLGTYPRENTK